MIKKKKVYKCSKCGNIVESLWDGTPSVSCCGQFMEEVTENTEDAAKEKHVPVIERNGDEVRVSVGSTLHPMTDEHYILFVEVLAGKKVYRHDFTVAGDEPVAVFKIAEKPVHARAYCNLHSMHAASE